MDKADRDKEILDTFRKVEVNIPLVEVIKHILKYAKFLKDLGTHKRSLKWHGRVNMGNNVSTHIHPMPQKCKYQETFSIPCTIGDSKIENSMLDLDVSINFMPRSIFNTLDLGPL